MVIKMKYLLLVLAIMASPLSAAPMSHQDKLECIQLAHDLASFDSQIPFEDQDELNYFFYDNENVVVSLVTRMNRLLHTYPDDHRIQAFAPLRDNLQAALDQMRTLNNFGAPVA